jgi:hypothetical protein
MFLCFEVALGLRINLGKSEIVPIGKVEDVDNLAHIFGCRVVSLPLKYLGLLLGASNKSYFYLEWSYWENGTSVCWLEEIIFV